MADCLPKEIFHTLNFDARFLTNMLRDQIETGVLAVTKSYFKANND